jgi:hypothetical protein
MGLKPTFTNTGPQDLPVNFVKGVIRVRPQADPRDSVILESKIVLPGAGDSAFTMKVYITNKDSLTFLTLALKESTLTNGAYAQLSGLGARSEFYEIFDQYVEQNDRCLSLSIRRRKS